MEDLDQSQSAAADELTVLKQRATLMGIKFSNNIGIDSLRAKINAVLEGDGDDAATATETAAEPAAAPVNPLAGEVPGKPVKKKTLRQRMFDEQMKLVRCRITCMNPQKKDLHGEVFTIANEVLGTIRKFVAFGEDTEDGYHIPFILYRHLESRKFLHIRTVKDKRTNTQQVKTSWAKEFAIEVLPQLTPVELQRLATAQAAAGSIGGHEDNE